jgi:hypothetical protein
MLREALASVRAARPDQLILVDDGSDFDVRALAVEYGVDQLLTAPPVGVQQRLTVPRHARQLTTGNFAHAASLIPTGAARWPTDVLNCLDHHFLVRLNARGRRHGASMFGAPCVGFAGWRREHALVVNNFSDGRGYTAGYRKVLEAGMLEATR